MRSYTSGPSTSEGTPKETFFERRSACKPTNTPKLKLAYLAAYLLLGLLLASCAAQQEEQLEHRMVLQGQVRVIPNATCESGCFLSLECVAQSGSRGSIVMAPVWGEEGPFRVEVSENWFHACSTAGARRVVLEVDPPRLPSQRVLLFNLPISWHSQTITRSFDLEVFIGSTPAPTLTATTDAAGRPTDADPRM